jgi:hypothetical protein
MSNAEDQATCVSLQGAVSELNHPVEEALPRYMDEHTESLNRSGKEGDALMIATHGDQLTQDGG